jgi:hypothetical protein
MRRRHHHQHPVARQLEFLNPNPPSPPYESLAWDSLPHQIQCAVRALVTRLLIEHVSGEALDPRSSADDR